MGAVIVLLAMFVCLICSRYMPEVVTPSMVGLAINYTLLVPIYLNWVVKFLSDVETQMAGVERVARYIDMPAEDYKTNGIVTIVKLLYSHSKSNNFRKIVLLFTYNVQSCCCTMYSHILLLKTTGNENTINNPRRRPKAFPRVTCVGVSPTSIRANKKVWPRILSAHLVHFTYPTHPRGGCHDMSSVCPVSDPVSNQGKYLHSSRKRLRSDRYPKHPFILTLT
ncbi:unnamed protein product [Nesidiocoris tenuis]|uniref:ABC transmembrane type-1 domain-containing protein n=1 Tax=Nesidiocoris tenuis TaxID=355587 RepID=A0A6H5GIB2_9HEMI|nr:unnamed protein product [Nesidiocoris tenuis]